MSRLGGNPTIVLGRPPFPPDQDVPSFPFQDFFDPKQRVVRHLHFLDVRFVKRACYRRAVPFTESERDDGMTTDVRHHKHFFRPARQIAFFEGAVFLLESTRSPTRHLGGGVLGYKRCP